MKAHDSYVGENKTYASVSWSTPRFMKVSNKGQPGTGHEGAKGK